jgi:hypothetical protein
VLDEFANQFKGVFETTFLPILVTFAMWLVAWCYPTRIAASTGLLLRACSIASLSMLLIQLVFSYHRYQRFGWLYDSLIRYYYPLMPIYGLAMAKMLQMMLSWVQRRKNKDETRR